MSAVAAREPSPVVIYRSVNRDGQTFGLDAEAVGRVRERFPDQVRVHPRVFIAHGTAADMEAVDIDLLRQVVTLLTGVSFERLSRELGEVVVLDSVTEQVLEPS